jgi:hypothetical protein
MSFRTVPVAHSWSLVVASLAERVAQPFEALVETITGCSASRLDVLINCQTSLVPAQNHDLPRHAGGDCGGQACR